MPDDVKQDILFRIGVVGSEKAAKNLRSVAKKVIAVTAAVAALTKVIGSSIESAQKFGQVFRANQTDMSLFNRDTAGLIDTTTALTKAVEFQEAGLRLTAEQMRAIGVAAADYAQNTGKSATEAFSLLTKSVITARETGLLPFGIELSQTADKSAAAQEALDKLIEKTKGVQLATESSEEAVYRFNNTFGTIKDMEIDAALNAFERAFANLGSSILGGIENLEEYEGQVHATNGAILEWKWTTEGFTNTLARNLDTIVEVAGLPGGAVGGAMGQLISSQEWLQNVISDANDEYERQIALMTEKANLIRKLETQRASEAKRIQMEQAYLSWVEKYSDAHSKLAESLKGTREDRLRAKKEFDRVLAAQPQITPSLEAAGLRTVLPELEREFWDPRVKGKRGRGGGRTGNIDDQEFDLASMEAELAEQERIRVSPRIFDPTQMIPGRGEAFETVGPQGRAAGKGSMEAQKETTKKEEKSQLERDADEADKRAEEEKKRKEALEAEKLEIRKYFLGEEMKLEEMNLMQKHKLYENSMSMTSDILGNFSAAQDKNSKRGFERQKALDYAQNATQTTLGATSAITGAFRSLPFPVAAVAGPAMAASIIAKGIANGQRIRNQKFGGGASSASSPALPSISENGGGGGGSNNFSFTFVLGGQTVSIMHEELMKENELQSQSGNKSFAVGN